MVNAGGVFLLLADFLAITLAGQRFFNALLFARLQIKGVPKLVLIELVLYCNSAA